MNEPNKSEGSRSKKPSREAMTAEMADLKAARESAEKQSTELQSRLEETTRRAADSETRIAALESEAAALRKKVEEAGQSARALDDARREVGHLQEQVTRAAVQISQAEQRVKSLEGELKAAKESEAAARDASQSERAQLLAKGAALEEELLRASTRTSGADERVKSLERELAEAKGASKARADGLEQEASGLRTRTDELQKARDAAQSECAQLQSKLAEAKEREVKGIQEADAAKARAGVLEKDVAALRKETEEADQVALEQQRSLEESRRMMEEYQAQAKLAAARFSETDRQVASLQQELARAKEQASEAASLRQTVERLGAEARRAESARKIHEALLGEFRQTLADLSKKLQEASFLMPAPHEEAETPPPAPVEKPREAAIDPLDALLSEPAAPPPAPPVQSEPPPAPPPPAAPATPATSASTACPAEVAEAATKAQNLFGPTDSEGRLSYVLLEVLFRDAMGGVYRAYDRSTSQFFAVRFMAGQAGEEQTAMMEQEVQKLIALPHPNILRVQGSGRRQNRLYVMMDLVRGEPLGQSGIRDIPRICRILRDSAEAVHYAHLEGTLHGDVNPENILVEQRTEGDHAFVKDFTLAHLLESEAQRTSTNPAGLMIRNTAFLPPEQMRDTKLTLSIAADVYGLGATLYAALAGRAPFEGKDVRQVRSRVMMEEPPPLERLRADVPGALAGVVRRAMAKQSGIRYATAKDLAEALTKVIEGKVTRTLLKPAVDTASKTEV